MEINRILGEFCFPLAFAVLSTDDIHRTPTIMDVGIGLQEPLRLFERPMTLYPLPDADFARNHRKVDPG